MRLSSAAARSGPWRRYMETMTPAPRGSRLAALARGSSGARENYEASSSGSEPIQLGGLQSKGKVGRRDAMVAVALVWSTMEVMMLGSSALPASASEDDLLEPTPTTTTTLSSVSQPPGSKVDVDLNPSLPSTVETLRVRDFRAFRLSVPDNFEEQNQEEEESGGGGGGGGGGGKGRSEDDLDNGPSFLGFGLSTPPGGRPGLKTSGVLARFQSASDGVSVYVAYTIGAQFKPTLLQVNDISQYGSPREVGDLVLPKASQGQGQGDPPISGLQVGARKVSAPTRDTGTLAGSYTPPPRLYYTYSFVRGQERTRLTLAASQGKVYWMAVTTAAGEGEGDALAKKIADSFRVK